MVARARGPEPTTSPGVRFLNPSTLAKPPGYTYVVDGPAEHGLPGLVQLFGIESPGLTSALSLAEEVIGELSERSRARAIPMASPAASR